MTSDIFWHVTLDVIVMAIGYFVMKHAMKKLPAKLHERKHPTPIPHPRENRRRVPQELSIPSPPTSSSSSSPVVGSTAASTPTNNMHPAIRLPMDLSNNVRRNTTPFVPYSHNRKQEMSPVAEEESDEGTNSRPDFERDNKIIDNYLAANNQNLASTPTHKNFQNHFSKNNNYCPTDSTIFLENSYQPPVPDYNSFESCANFKNSNFGDQNLNEFCHPVPPIHGMQNQEFQTLENQKNQPIFFQNPGAAEEFPKRKQRQLKEKRPEVCRRYVMGKCRDSARRCVFLHPLCTICNGKHHTVQHHTRSSYRV